MEVLAGIYASLSHFDRDIYIPTIPGILDLAEPEEVEEQELEHSQQWIQMGYFDMHPERWHIQLTRDKDVLDQFTQAASGMEPPLPCHRVTQPPTVLIHLVRRHLLCQHLLSLYL